MTNQTLEYVAVAIGAAIVMPAIILAVLAWLFI